MFDVLRKYWNPIAKSEDVTNTPLACVMLGEELVVWRGANGKATVMKDLCIHRGTKFTAGGHVDGDSIVCPYHGWTYDGQGVCTKIPSLPEGAPIPAKARTTVYPTHEAFGVVWAAQSENPEPFPTYMEELDKNPEYRMALAGIWDWKTSAGRMVENAMDFSHFNFVHQGYIELSDGPVVKPYPVEKTETGLKYEYNDTHLLRQYTLEFPFQIHDSKTIVNPEGGQTWSDKGTGKEGDATVLSFIAAPMTETTTRIYVFVSRNHALDRPDSEFTDGFDTVMEQDRTIVESQRPEKIPVDVKEELHMRVPDQAAVAYRRMLRDLGLNEAYMP